MPTVIPVKISATILGATYAQQTVEIPHLLRPTVAAALTRTVTPIPTAMMQTVQAIRIAIVKQKENGAVITMSAVLTIAVERNANNISKI
jgi:hypothetical protein